MYDEVSGLEGEFSGTRDASNEAVRAATAYGNITDLLRAAVAAGKNASTSADEATKAIEGKKSLVLVMLLD